MEQQITRKVLLDIVVSLTSVRRRVLYIILIEVGVHMKQVRLIKMCLNETYSKVHIGRHLSDSFPIKNGLNQRDVLSHCFSTSL
jgi:hypothetical protein